jgi:hypothetical protein
MVSNDKVSNMKQIKILSLFLILLVQVDSRAQSEKYGYDVVSLPRSQNLFTSFYINENNQVFIAINGGVYLPKDSLWFLPPAKEFYFTSMAPNVNDTGVFVLANTVDSTKIYYLKSSANGSIKKFHLVTMSKGVYNLIYKNGLCCVWGYDANDSRIGILSSGGIKWLITVKGIISQVQVNDSSEMYFSLKSSIYQLNNRKKVITVNSEISGFDFDRKGNMIVSCREGIGLVSKDSLTIIARGITGLVQYRNENVFVLPRKGGYLYDIHRL